MDVCTNTNVFEKRKVEDAVHARLQAQSDKAHYEAKLAEALKKVEDADSIAEVTQEEFTVRLHSSSFPLTRP